MKAYPRTKKKSVEIRNMIERRDKQIAGCMLATLGTLFLAWVKEYNEFYILSADLDFRATAFICLGLVFAVAMLQQDRVEKEEQLGS